MNYLTFLPILNKMGGLTKDTKKAPIAIGAFLMNMLPRYRVVRPEDNLLLRMLWELTFCA